MNRILKGLLTVGAISWCGVLTGTSGADDTAPPPPGRTTFYKDVLPILQQNCQGCHRAGEVAPMPLTTYEEARPWAVAMKMAVLTKKMPPWYADPRHGRFSNERKLTPREVRALVSWVDGGAQPGDPGDQPAPVKFTDGWNIGTPDRVLEMPAAFSVPAEGTIDYQWVVIPGGFTQDTWVRAAEIRPGNRALVHHVIALIRPPGSQWMKDVKPGEFFVPKKEEKEGKEEAAPRSDPPGGETKGEEVVESEGPLPLVAYAPGLQALELTDQARLITAGSDIVLQMHYTANGTAGTDRTRIGLIHAKEPPRLRNVQFVSRNMDFTIPPHDANYEVKSQVVLEDTVLLMDLMPHMHFRGKDFLIKVVYPDGRTETLLSVPNYDFNWQLVYRLAEPLVLPRGTRMECTAHFDNSINNPHNPDPTRAVKWGDQTWEEMMGAFFSVAVDPKVKTGGLVKSEEPGTRATSRPDGKPARTTVRSAGRGSR